MNQKMAMTLAVSVAILLTTTRMAESTDNDVAGPWPQAYPAVTNNAGAAGLMQWHKTTMSIVASTASLHALVKSDPYAFVDLCISNTERELDDYECLFTKRERVKGKLRTQSISKVLCRNEPFSVYMIGQGKHKSCRRALYVKGQLTNRKGEELVRVEPNGWRRALVKEAKIAIHDKKILSKNRNSIDQFGFNNMLKRFQRVNRKAQANGDLELQFSGEGQVDGRPTFVLTRQTPYSGDGGLYPDAKVIMHIDQEWLLPVWARCYADWNRQTLLGSYRFTDVQLNTGLNDASFEF